MRCLTAQDTSGNSHDQRSRDAFTGNIGDDHAKAMIVNADVIEIIAANLASRKINARDLEAGNDRRFVRKQAALDLACNFKIMIEAFFLVGLGIDDGIVKGESGLLCD